MACGSREVVRCAGALTAARGPGESIPAGIPGRANVAAGTSAADSPLWRTAEHSAVDPPNSRRIRQHLVGEAHRRVLVGMDTGLDLSTFPDPTEPTGVDDSDRRR